MKRLSFIVPMYNVEPYIERCIRSLEDQDIPKDDYEVICINDGSPDNCRDVVIRLQKEFSNIILIDQENKGVSVARNRGIERASGEYLMMIDPDDYIISDILKDISVGLKKNNPDIALTSFTILDEELNEEYRFEPEFKLDYIPNGIELIRLIRNTKDGIDKRDQGRSWASLLRKDFIEENRLRYLPDVPYLEDSNFMAKVYCLAKRADYISGPCYQRTTRPGSATHSRLYFSSKARDGFLKAALDLIRFQKEKCNHQEQINFINGYLIHFVMIYINSHIDRRALKNYGKMYRNLKEGPLRRISTEGCTGFYKIMVRYYNISLALFIVRWTIYKAQISLKNRLRTWQTGLRTKSINQA